MKRKIITWLLIAVVGFSLVFTCLLGLAIATDYLHLGQLTQVVLLLKGRSLERVSFATLVDGATTGMVQSLKDPYSAYLTKDKLGQFLQQLDGSFGGVGLVLDTSNESELRVIRVLEGSPAERKGIKKGDLIVTIEGKTVSEVKATPASNLLRGPVGSSINLTILRGKNPPRRYTLKREIINIKSVEGKLVNIPEPVAYIKINSFNQNTLQDFQDFLAKAPEFKGVVLDLRDNTGGTLDSALEIANYFVPKGPVVHLVDKTGKRETYEVGGDRLNLPLMVLVNGETASASEILAGAIQDTASGLIVGSKTYGKGVVQTIYELGDSSALKITTAKYLTALGRDINKQGIIPDVLIRDQVTDDTDQAYHKALQLLAERF